MHLIQAILIVGTPGVDTFPDDEELRFAPPSGHRCVCQRTLGGGNGQRINKSLSVQSLRYSVSLRA